MEIFKLNNLFYALPGSDINISELKIFEKGDKFLIELNGSDSNPGKFSQTNPMASINWVVVHNASSECIINNELLNTQLVLEYENIIQDNPAVFEKSIKFHDVTKKSTIIPKLIAYHLPEKALEAYWAEFYRVNQISRIRNSPSNLKAATILVFKFIKDLNKFGWQFNSLNRFSLRAGVDVNTIYYIHENDLERVFNDDLLTYDDISKIYKATLLYSSFWKQQALETGVDEDRVIDLPKWNERK